jgi:hypothetical protein
MKIKIKTNAGFNYSGELLEENLNYIILIDWKEGEVQIPISNISFLKKIKERDSNGS